MATGRKKKNKTKQKKVKKGSWREPADTQTAPEAKNQRSFTRP
jgi:hypothetical protein